MSATWFPDGSMSPLLTHAPSIVICATLEEELSEAHSAFRCRSTPPTVQWRQHDWPECHATVLTLLPSMGDFIEIFLYLALAALLFLYCYELTDTATAPSCGMICICERLGIGAHYRLDASCMRNTTDGVWLKLEEAFLFGF